MGNNNVSSFPDEETRGSEDGNIILVARILSLKLPSKCIGACYRRQL